MRALAFLLLAGCGAPKLTPADDAELAAHAALLAKCQAEGRAVGKDGGLATYEACKADAGIR